MISRIDSLRRRCATARDLLARAERLKRGGIAAARRRLILAKADLLRAELAAARQGKALLGAAIAKSATPDLFQIGA